MTLCVDELRRLASLTPLAQWLPGSVALRTAGTLAPLPSPPPPPPAASLAHDAALAAAYPRLSQLSEWRATASVRFRRAPADAASADAPPLPQHLLAPLDAAPAVALRASRSLSPSATGDGVDASPGAFASLAHVRRVEAADIEAPGVLEAAAAARAYRGELILLATNADGAAMVRSRRGWRAQRTHITRGCAVAVLSFSFPFVFCAQAVNALLQLRALGLAHYLLVTPRRQDCEALSRTPAYADVAGGACVWSSLFQGHPGLRTYRLGRGDAGKGPFRVWWARLGAMARLVVRPIRIALRCVAGFLAHTLCSRACVASACEQELRYGVLYLDTDVMLTRDPYPFLKARTRAHAKALFIVLLR
jgi:hypothetical protein